MTDVVVYKEDGRYCSFPHIIKINNKLIAVFRRASNFSVQAALKGTHTHHDPDSEICLIESHDSGLSWDEKTFQVVYKSEYGVNDPSLTLLRDGTLLLRFVALKITKSLELDHFPKKIFSHRAEHGLVSEVVNNLLLSSVDNGTTWNYHSEIKCDHIGPSCSRDPLIELEDGSLIAPVYTGAPQRSDISWSLRSFDKGLTWGEPSIIGIDENGKFSERHGINYNETSLLSMGNGELLALVRGDETFHTTDEFMPVGGMGKLHLSRSYNGGMNWSNPVDTKIFGQPGHIISLGNHKFLCTYGYRKSPFGVRAVISHDNAISWDLENEIIIAEGFKSWDCGYPFSIMLSQDRVLTIFYANDQKGNRYIASKIWNL
jgi:sialidase-1